MNKNDLVKLTKASPKWKSKQQKLAEQQARERAYLQELLEVCRRAAEEGEGSVRVPLPSVTPLVRAELEMLDLRVTPEGQEAVVSWMSEEEDEGEDPQRPQHSF